MYIYSGLHVYTADSYVLGSNPSRGNGKRKATPQIIFPKPLKMKWRLRKHLENPGIDPGTSHMLSERSTI